MSNPEDKAVIRCSNYAMKKAFKYWGYYHDQDNQDDQDDLDTALKYCSLAIKINPQNASAYALRGSMYNSKQWFKRACRDLNKAISFGLHDEFVYTDLGFAHMLEHECSEAVNNFSIALAINPEHFSAWSNRGYTFIKMSLFEKAVPDLKIALSLIPNDPIALLNLNDAYYGRGNLYLKADRNLEAVDDFTKATSSRDFIVKAYEGRATAYTNLGRFDEATADIAKAKYFREEQEHSKMNSHGE